MNTRNLLVGLTIAGLMVPQFALAAWWNPFSWNVFHKTETKTQVLEARVKELEKKLGNTATSTSSIATTTNKTQTKAAAKPIPATPITKVETKPQLQKTENIVPASDKTVDRATITQLMTLANDKISQFNREIADSKKQISKNLSEMAEYPNDSIFQQAGQELISNSSKTNYLAGKIVETYTKLLDKVTPYSISTSILYEGEVIPILREIKSYNTEYDTGIVLWKASVSSYLTAYAKALDNETARLKGLINQANQSTQTNYSNSTSNKQVQLNAVNQKIADLNAKYVQDLKDVDTNNAGRGITTSTSDMQKAAIDRIYRSNYNALQAEYQQIQYSN